MCRLAVKRYEILLRRKNFALAHEFCGMIKLHKMHVVEWHVLLERKKNLENNY